MELDEDKLKKSFLKVREDIEALKTQLNELKSLINEIANSSKNSQKTEDNFPKVPQAPKEAFSTGNDGVYANIHSFIHSFNIHSTDKHADIHAHPSVYSNPKIGLFPNPGSHSPEGPKWSLSNIKEIDSLFLSLTKQEFFTFMLIYQLEEDLKRGVSYLELSRNMSLSEGCIRTYLSQMLKKGIPIKKIKLNNKLTLLSIDLDFKSLNLKPRLSSLLSKSDPDQTTLF